MSQLSVLSVIMDSEKAMFSKAESLFGKMYRHAILPILLTTVAFPRQIFNKNYFISKHELTDQGRYLSSVLCLSLVRFSFLHTDSLGFGKKLALKFILTDMFLLVYFSFTREKKGLLNI